MKKRLLMRSTAWALRRCLNQSLTSSGIALLEQSLAISLNNSYHEHAARAYAALGSNAITMKDYAFAKERHWRMELIIAEERDLDSLKLYMLSWKARLYLETGNWREAFTIANNLLKRENLLRLLKSVPWRSWQQSK
jgi:IS5 family transposase